jgi:nucleoid DNA-binding protein
MAVKKKVSKKKVTAKKKIVTKKKVTTKKKASKSTAAVPAKKLTAIKDRMSQSQIIAAIAEDNGLTKAQVAAVFDSLADYIERSIKPRSVGSIILPKIGVKVSTKEVPAKPKRQVRNPFTGEMIWKEKSPKSRTAKAVALKALKDRAS